MKRRLFTFALAALTIGLLGSCSKINERIDGLDKRAYDIENKQIASVDQQVAAIKASIADLEAIRADVKTAMDAKTAQGEDITALQTADQVLEGKINDLRTYVDTELAKYASTEWANATFATLEKQAEILADIAALKTGLEGVDSKIDEAIAGLDSSMKGWVNDQLSAYYKKAEMDAKVKALQDELDALKAGGETDKSKIEGLETKLTELTEDLEAAKATIKTEYEAAITAAINENNGTINQTIQSKIDEVNATITALTGRVEALETTIGVLSGRIDAIEAMIQTVTIVPAYDDGSVESTKDGVLHLDIIVTPAEAVATLTKGCLKVMVNEVKTKAVDLDTVAVTKFKVDAAKGTITARADISSNLPVASGKALTIAVNVKNGISDYTTEFYPVTLSTESNVTITDGPTATNVTIKDDEDFPESSAGNIVVADGFKDTKPTSVSIPMPSLKVGGIGTVTFNEEATAKIKANAEGSTNVFFKVEDVTTTKPVPNADVVLEVTMKTVDENGKEVFNEENAAGEVTIQIPMDENVAYVNSVTLVNDAGEPIEGGVVPGSEEIENGILTFKVNHFSKYAVDYVTKADFVAVTGVSIELASVTLQVGDTLRLAAIITPDNATNKKVTWSSSDTTKVKVDDTGKITAVAFGQATITVTTKDGNKTADCAVKVSETKTMADILKTTTGIPESQNLTPPANAWVNSTDPDCKAFVGIDAEGDTLFVILKEGSGLAPLGICMDDDFEKIDDNTYQRVEPSVGTFTIKMAEGKFTSYEFAAVSGSAYEQFNGTYSAPVSKEYVEIAAKYDGSTVSTLRWYRQSLAITGSGKKAWKSDSGSAVKVPGTGEDVVVGDYFQWGTFAGFYGSGADSDKGLLPYTSFTSTGCGDGSDAFTFKDGKQFNQTNAPYWSGSAYTKYNATDQKTELDASDDVASIILGGTWRMPTTKEFQALKEVTYWAWDATDKGYYVYTPNPASDAGKVNDGTGTYNKADALLFFPTAGNGYENTYYDVEYIADYWYGSLNSASIGSACHLFFNSSGGFNADSRDSERFRGFSVRPVQDPAATYVGVTNVSLDVTAKEIEKGGNVQLKVTVAPATATQNGVYWTSSAPTVATADATGKVTAVAAGTATITATTVDGSKTATCTVTVTAPVTTFKAVYNTNGGANTLTFYYDAVDHSGEGITVYDNLPTAANNDAAWGYNSVRKKIKKVVITESVKEYSSLTSTACMFHDMTIASSIEGAEYLDVSNVTNMMAMFWNFGSDKSSTLESAPEVDNWNTGKVENMQNMFMNYGAGPGDFNDVPNVSNWDTRNVTNMSSMFKGFASTSEELECAPKVNGTNWKTDEVKDMSGMFCEYGKASKKLKEAPDVISWNTQKVTKMGDMFLYYGYTSTALNTVPDVSGWNTINVTTMANMFQNYGYSSTALSTVPNVSNWKTGKVTSMTNMFNGYGYKSTNISCVLDLSGWDLSKITSGDDVFKFKPSTFDVTIPAKTGEKSNEGGKWYYGNGTNHIAPPAGKTFTLLALKGVFSVSATKKVRFSKGNLQATYNSSASAYTWGFAANQYDYIGNAAGNTTIDSQTNGAVVDLFGWSTASTTYGISTSRDDKNYSGDFVDWGKAIDDKGTWSTLSKDEWTYLINTREVNGGTKEGKSYQRATINSDATSVYGMILYPDNFTSQTSATSYTSIEWTTMEENGCVFLPAAGNRSIAEVGGGGGGFWSSTALDKGDSYLLIFKDSLLVVIDDLRSLGYSVRLVTEVK